MVRRSLTTSKDGIKRAKQALKRKSLTQKAIYIELGIASRTTVASFFNGRPVDRLIFHEICEALDLEWSEIVAQESAKDEEEESAELSNDKIQKASVPSIESRSPSSSTDLISATNKQGAIARDALTPRILERIPRTVVREKYLPAIARGVELEKPRLIPILGPAGHGKSTILSDIYDELIAGNTAWVGLILCSTLSLPDDSDNLSHKFAVELGYALCDQSRSILDITNGLNHHGRGVSAY